MGLVRNRTLFTDRWRAGLVPRGTEVNNCTVEIYSRQIVDNGTTQPVENSKSVAYTGPARMQPLRTTLSRDATGSQEQITTVQFQLPMTDEVLEIDFTSDMVISITDAFLPAAVGWVGTTKGVVDAANAIERTLTAELEA